jgi:hypothetical protein
MAGLKIVLPGTFTDTSLPILRDDAILTNGSLVLLDPAHSARPWAAGVPANNASIPNIAWKEAAALHGSGTQAEWDQLFQQNGVYPGTPGGPGFLERTGKGAFHVCMSQATQSGNGYGITLGNNSTSVTTKLKDYLFAHLDNDYYVSVWERVTRAAVANSVEEPVSHFFSNTASATGAFLFMMNRASNSGTGKSEYNSPALPVTAPGMAFRAMSETAYQNTKPAAALNMATDIFCVGYSASGYTAFGQNKARSTVFYRAYLEDLTVSGRTFAQVQTLDKALFDAAFAAGGRYYGDTFTDPATYP